MRNFMLLSMAVVGLMPLAITAGQENKATQSARPEAGETVVLGSQVLQRTSANGVRVKDLLLDLETAHVALLVIQWKHADKGEDYQAVLPWSAALPQHAVDSTFWKSLSTLPPEGVNRGFANSVYSAAKRDIYWSQQAGSGIPADFDRERFQLSAYSKVVGQAVVDKHNKSLGKITDLGINDTTGEIVYCILSSEGEHRAIPLGAFTAGSKSVAWVIDLDREQILVFETCDLESPPQAVARGWQEFVAVNYGRNAVQGADANEKSKKQ